MKVLKKPQEWTKKEVTCDPQRGCGTVMEVELQDLKATRHPGDQRDQTPDWTEVYVNCPTCGASLQIKDVPEYQQKKILANRTPAQWMDR